MPLDKGGQPSYRPRSLAAQLALETRYRHGIKAYPVPVEAIAEREGAEVQLAYLPFSDGSLTYANPRPVIRISETASLVRRRFTIAHELGHLMLDRFRHDRQLPKLFVSRSNKVEEMFCNWFANHLLIAPEWITDLRTWESLSLEGMRAVAEKLQVSPDALAQRLCESLPFKGGVVPCYTVESLLPERKFAVYAKRPIYPKRKPGTVLPDNVLVPESSPIYYDAALYWQTLRSTATPPEEKIYVDIDVSFLGIAGVVTRTVRIGSIGTWIWLIVYPPEIDTQTIPVEHLHLMF